MNDLLSMEKSVEENEIGQTQLCVCMCVRARAINDKEKR